MDTSIFSAVHGPLAWACLLSAAIAAAMLLIYIVRRPPLTTGTKLFLLMGLVIFPVASATTGNIAGFEATSQRSFCGGCHVMTPYLDDVVDPFSTSLASMHGRNDNFGGRACYACHADYGMYGTVVTKMGGMGHVYEYYFNGYHAMSLEEARDKIHIKRPFPNSTCMHCHSTRLPGFANEPDHEALIESLEREQVSCASDGCHGPAHPFSKRPAAPVEVRP